MLPAVPYLNFNSLCEKHFFWESFFAGEASDTHQSKEKSRNLHRCKPREVERVMGIEPTTSAWEADVLPLNYTRISLAV